ncbi:unnamed protein product [Boreogadus saida]
MIDLQVCIHKDSKALMRKTRGTTWTRSPPDHMDQVPSRPHGPGLPLQTTWTRSPLDHMDQLRCQFSSRSTPAGAAGKLRRQISSRSTLPELPDCRRSFSGGRTALTSAGLPPAAVRSYGGGSSAAVRQLSSGNTIPFSYMSPPADCRRSFDDSPAEKGIVLPELSCNQGPPAGAARPLVHKIVAML